MKHARLVLTAIMTLAPMTHAMAVDILGTRNLVLVKENHATVAKNGNNYLLDSYIVMFQQPYYITVKRVDNRPIALEEAVEIAEEYIKPRGCTEPLSRRPDLDRSNRKKTEWLIGVEC